MPDIKFIDVNKKYGDKIAVESLNLTINEGEFFTFLGATGAGKSAAVRMLVGLDEVSGGEIFYGEENITKTPPKDRDFSIVFKNASLFTQMTAFDNIAFSLRLRKISHPEIEVRVRWAAKIMGVSDCLNKKPKMLFGPQKMRVALARAIVREPRAVVFDEPFSDLDANLTRLMRAELVKLQKRLKTTFIYATRDQIEALTVSDRIAVMNGGKIEQIGTPTELYSNPKTVFVATYIGSPTINLAHSVIEADESGAFSVKFGDNKIALSEAVALKIADVDAYKNTGKPIFIGVRSENIAFADEGIDVTVDSIEDFGGECIYYFKHKQAVSDWAIRGESGKFKVGDSAKISIDSAKLLLFDKETEVSILE